MSKNDKKKNSWKNSKQNVIKWTSTEVIEKKIKTRKLLKKKAEENQNSKNVNDILSKIRLRPGIVDNRIIESVQ